MKNSLYQATLLAVSLTTGSLALSQMAYADITVVYEQSSGTQKTETTMQVKEGKIRFTPPNQSNNYSLYDSQTNQLIHIDTDQKKYLTMDEAMIEKQIMLATQQMDNMRKAMQEKMKDMPPEQKKQVEQMMNNHLSRVAKKDQPDTLTKKKTSRSETISGIQCTIYEAYLNGIKQSELCMSSADKMNIDQSDANALKEMQKFMKRMQKVAQNMNGNITPSADIQGIPLHTTLYKEDGSVRLETRLKNLSRETIQNDVVSMPSDFSMMKIPGME